MAEREVSLSLSLSPLGQGNSSESISTRFHDRLTEGYKRSFRTEGGRPGTLEEAFSRSVKIGKVLARVNSLLKRLFLTRNCLKLVYTRTGGTSEIDSPPLPLRPPSLSSARPPAHRMRLIFLPGCVLFPTGRSTTRPLTREAGPPTHSLSLSLSLSLSFFFFSFLFATFHGSLPISYRGFCVNARICTRALFIRESGNCGRFEINTYPVSFDFIARFNVTYNHAYMYIRTASFFI